MPNHLIRPPNARLALAVAIALAGLTGCSGGDRVSDADSAGDADSESAASVASSAPAEVPVLDSVAPAAPVDESATPAPLLGDPGNADTVYDEDGYGTDDVVRVDVRTVLDAGACDEDDDSGCTLADVMADTNSADDFKPDVAVHFSADDFPDDGTSTNAQLRQRGGFTRFAAQKSFRVRMDDKNAVWRDERTLQLNKHPYDNDRVRNALAMELLASVPHLMSFRTQFANLWIDDDGAGATDYGLFTHVERPGKRWLERRGEDGDGRLYKPSLFGFTLDTRELMQTDEQGRLLTKSRLEHRLKIENGKDHRAIGVLMDALHDPSRTFESVLDQHFDRDNIQSWLAINILLHHREAITHNYLLYNPAGTERFYFVPWDYDATFAREQEPDAAETHPDALRSRLNAGYARNKDNLVIRRFLQMPGAHERMLAATDELRTRYLTADSVSVRADAMAIAIAPWLQRAPDSDHLQAIDGLPGQRFLESIEHNAEALATSFAYPMAPTLQEPVIESERWSFAWTPAVEVTGSGVSYELQISTSPNFDAGDLIASVGAIADGPDLIEQTIAAPTAAPGSYFVRVIARADVDPARFWQVADNVVEWNDQDWPGMVGFTVQ